MRFQDNLDAIPKSGGSHTPRATEHKDAAAERLADLVGGSRRLHGVENTDDLKAGDLTPEARMSAIKDRLAFHERALRALEAEPGITAFRKGLIAEGIRLRIGRLQEAFLEIAVDMPEAREAKAERSNARCRRCGRMLEPPKGVLGCACREPSAPRPMVSDKRCPKCNRLVSPPPGVFGCSCGGK